MSKPLLADDLLFGLAEECGVINKDITEAKRHLAEAIEWIISEDEFHPTKPMNMSSKPWKETKMSPGLPMTLKDKDRNELRAEQRKRLAEWLGEKIE